MVELLLLWFFPALMTAAAVSDLLTMTIPNRLSLALAAGFGLACAVAGLGLPQTAAHVSAGAAMLVLGLAGFAFGWIGGGDAKLFAAAALWFGWETLGEYALAAGILGGGLTLAILVLRQVPLPAPLHQGWLLRLHDPKAGVPYGIALAAAAVLLYPHTIWFVQAAAAALWFGWETLGEYALAAGILGGGLTLAVLVLRQVPLPAPLHHGWLLRLHDPKAGVPYGIALAAAAILLYPHTIWFVQAAAR